LARFLSFFSIFFRSSAARASAIFTGFEITDVRKLCSDNRIIKSGSLFSLFHCSFLGCSSCAASKDPVASLVRAISSSAFGATYFLSPSKYASASSD